MPVAPYGTWRSPLSSALLARGNLRYGFTAFADDQALYWNELRSADQGRNVIVQLASDGSRQDLLPAPYSARSRVHEYGGRSYLIADGQLWFVNQVDQQVYTRVLQGTDAAVRQLTCTPSLRFAELTLDRGRARLLAIAERHEPGNSSHAAVENFIASIDLQTGAVDTLASGHDFYAALALSADGSQLAFLSWNHPYMPWDAAQVRLAAVRDDGGLEDSVHIAGSSEASALQPTWSPDGLLYFTCEVNGAWTLHRRRDGSVERLAAAGGEPCEPCEPCEPREPREPCELGAPLWQLGTRLWDFAGDHTVVGVCFENGLAKLVSLDLRAEASHRQWQPLSQDYPYIGQLSASAGQAVFTLGWAGSGSEIVRFDLAHNSGHSVACAHQDQLEPADTSQPEPIAFSTSHGETAHGFFYAPKNQLYSGPANEAPPLVVLVHGGPTAGAAATWNSTVQHFTTRGFAVLDVNYRGSSGFGRAYRDRLRGEWGVLDVDDCVAGAEHLASSGRVDAARMFIRGGSAGGYTVLQALANHSVFAAGSCHYGISDLEALTRDTHKFESHYDRFLIGPYPERRDLFVSRSPIHYVQKIRRPVIFFQGLEDRVVPADQTERMAKTLLAHGVQAEYHAYAGEAHGFRKSETIEHVLETELVFFHRVMSRL